MTEERIKEILEETGGDCFYADIFLEAAVEAATKKGAKIEQKLIDFFYNEVDKYKRFEIKN